MGRDSWFQNAFLVLRIVLITPAIVFAVSLVAIFFLSNAEAATRKYVPMPSAQSVGTGSGTPSRSGGTLSIPGAAQGEYLPGYNQNRQIPIKVLPRIDYSIPRTFEHAKRGMRFGWPGLAGSVALGLAFDNFDWDWGEDGLPYKTKFELDGVSVLPRGDFSPGQLCQMPAAETMGNFIYHKDLQGVQVVSGVVPNAERETYISMGYESVNNCTSSALGYKHVDGRWPVAVTRPLSSNEVPERFSVPLAEQDYSALDDWMTQQDAEWLKDLLKDVCSASPSPNRCFDEMVEGSALSGPTTVPGGSTTSMTTTTNADGTQSQTTATTTTTYNIKYGDNYYDYSQTRSTRITHPDGSTSEQVTSEPESDLPPEEEEPSYSHQDSDFPDVTPFYDVKYPDGLQSVWSAARQRLDDSAFISFLHSFVPSFSGSCPSWSLGFNIATWANFGTQSFQSLCYVFDFIKVIMLVSAAFSCRAIVFGG